MDDLPSLHNISFGLNLTSILDYLPSRLLARFMFRFKPPASPTVFDLDALPPVPPPTISDLLSSDEWEGALATAAAAAAATGKTSLSGLKNKFMASEQRPSSSLFVGPLGFFTSGYMIGLFLMAFVLHRLHHTVIPSRLARRRHPRRGRQPSNQSVLFIQIYRSIFPIDLSRTRTRFILQFPTLYCLLRMCLLWGLIILQTTGVYPETFPSSTPDRVVQVMQRLGAWAARKPMDEICWISFCSLILAYFVESFVRKLDELANGTVEEMHLGRQMSPYTLIAHSFVLYLFSLSASHINKPEGLPPRPDTHALITMGIPLLQSTLFHILCISKKHANHRLIPTAIASFLALIHFHATLYIRGYPAVFLPLLSDRLRDPENNTTNSEMNNAFSGTGFRSSYPLMNYFSCLIETTLISIIILTVLLNAIVQLLVNGRVDRVFTTLGIAAAGGLTATTDPDSESDAAQFSWSNLPFEEEWGVVLMRIGTASLEATGLRGWGNEVAPISAPTRAPAPPQVRPQVVRRRGRGPLVPQPEPPVITRTYGSVRVGRSGVGRVFSGYRYPDAVATGSSSGSTGVGVGSGNRYRGSASVAKQPGRPVPLKGWDNEVRAVEMNGGVGSPGGAGGVAGSAERQRWVWLRELIRFSKAISGVLYGLARVVWTWAAGRWRTRKGCVNREAEERLRHRTHVADMDGSRLSEAVEVERGREERVLYERFLRGEEISDDEDDAGDYGEGGEYRYEDEDGSEVSSDVEDDDGAMEAGPSMRFEREGSMAPEEPWEREEEAIELFTDLVKSQGVDEGSKLILSHLVHGSARATGSDNAPAPPLTRRRWGEMGRLWGLGITDDVDGDVWDWGLGPLRGARGEEAEDEKKDANWADRATCIICTSRSRDIVSWPCRCLVMCDQCREVLATRGSPGKHFCPCCRQPIDGYSRIFIP